VYGDRTTRAYRRLARSRRVVDVALRVRNIATVLTAHRLTDGLDPNANGEMWFLPHGLGEARTVVDVGANLGNWLAPALEAGPHIARAIAYEPAHHTAEELSRRFSADPRVTVVEAAVSDQPGQTTFWEEPGHGETSSLAAGHPSAAATARTVDVVTLDDEFVRLGLDSVDLLKIDAEGYDLHVLRGTGSHLARAAIGIVQFEYNDPWRYAGSTLHAAIAFLRGHGYETFLLKASALHAYDGTRYPELFWYANFVALAPAARERMASLIRPPL
jgi:FkbM family methyltransferase